jgi:hypothetical protein
MLCPLESDHDDGDAENTEVILKYIDMFNRAPDVKENKCTIRNFLGGKDCEQIVPFTMALAKARYHLEARCINVVIEFVAPKDIAEKGWTSQLS